MNKNTFEKECKRLLKKMDYEPLPRGHFENNDFYHKEGHWHDIVLYHLGYCVTLKTEDTTEQTKALKRIRK